MLVEGDKEHVRALQPVQGGLHVSLGGSTSHDGGNQRGAELLQHRGPHEQLLHGRSLLGKDFLHQVAAHQAVRGVLKPLQERRAV